MTEYRAKMIGKSGRWVGLWAVDGGPWVQVVGEWVSDEMAICAARVAQVSVKLDRELRETVWYLGEYL